MGMVCFMIIYYEVSYCVACRSDLFKDCYRWLFYKRFNTRSAALNSIKRLKEKTSITCFYRIDKHTFQYGSEPKNECVYSEV